MSTRASIPPKCATTYKSPSASRHHQAPASSHVTAVTRCVHITRVHNICTPRESLVSAHYHVPRTNTQAAPRISSHLTSPLRQLSISIAQVRIGHCGHASTRVVSLWCCCAVCWLTAYHRARARRPPQGPILLEVSPAHCGAAGKRTLAEQLSEGLVRLAG